VINTAVYTFITVIIKMGLGFLVAVLLNQKMRGRTFSSRILLARHHKLGDRFPALYLCSAGKMGWLIIFE